MTTPESARKNPEIKPYFPAIYHQYRNTNRLTIGQRIFIPGPLVWVVEAGDSWEKIATYYGYSVQAVKDRNPGKSLTPGTVLVLWKAGER